MNVENENFEFILKKEEELRIDVGKDQSAFIIVYILPNLIIG
jgi:hypothetical protein